MAGIEIWQRTENGTKKARGKKPIGEKESYKWVKAMEKTQKYLNSIKRKIFVTDRESDIYEYMNLVEKNGDKFIVRAAHNRKIKESKEEFYLEEHINKAAITHTFETLIGETPTRKERIAKLHLKYGKLNLIIPKGIIEKEQYDKEIAVSFIDVEEDLYSRKTGFQVCPMIWKFSVSNDCNSDLYFLSFISFSKK